MLSSSFIPEALECGVLGARPSYVVGRRRHTVESRIRLDTASGCAVLGSLFSDPVNISVCYLARGRAWDAAPRSNPICNSCSPLKPAKLCVYSARNLSCLEGSYERASYS